MRVLLIGNYGVGNLGDEALKEFFLHEFTEVEWTVVSACPENKNEVARLPLGVRSFLCFSWLRTLKKYAQCDAIVYGSGSLFTDTESVFACILWWVHSVPARLFGKPIHMSFQGIGPFKTRVGERLARSVLQSARTISVRDQASKKRAESLCKNTKIVQSIDPVVLLLNKQKIGQSTQNVLTLIPRNNSSDKFTTAAQNHSKSKEWNEIRIISMEPDNPLEQKFVKSLQEAIGEKSTVHDVRTLEELCSHMSISGLVLSERFHGALAAKVFSVPVEIVSQADGDKLSQLSVEDLQPSAVQPGIDLLRSSLGEN